QYAAGETAKHHAEEGKTAEESRFARADVAGLAQKRREEGRIENVRGCAKELLSANQREPAARQERSPRHGDGLRGGGRALRPIWANNQLALRLIHRAVLFGPIAKPAKVPGREHQPRQHVNPQDVLPGKK